MSQSGTSPPPMGPPPMGQAAPPASNGAFPATRFLGARFDLVPVEGVIAALQARRAGMAFAYVVTPNVDHVVRLARQPELAPAYDGAWMSWNDSHPIRRLGRFVGLALPHLNGTDVVERIFAEVLEPGDAIAVVGSDEALIADLKRQFPAYRWVGHVPPFGFGADPQAFEAAARFVIDHPARFVFLGVGSPAQERLAQRIAADAAATGTAFCTGASLEFITGRKTRAPQAMQALGLEWLHRLAREPGRLWRRYVLSALPLIGLFARDVASNGFRRGG